MNKTNQYLVNWVEYCREFYQASNVVWYDGSYSSYSLICSLLVEDGTFIPLNQEKYPNSFWSHSHPNDVARVENRTFICCQEQSDAGPTNNWEAPDKMRTKLDELMQGCMSGRTMYVIPYLMGPKSSPYSRFGVEITDSLYVVANMHIMTLTGSKALEELPDDENNFVRGVHSMGTLNEEQRYIAHFPESKEIFSFNTNYGGNVLQSKKCFALRLASKMAQSEGWLAEHMLILGITRPDGKKHYIAAAFPSACGKTNLAMLQPPKIYQEQGWKVETVGDDIAWLNFGEDGRLYAINPERGFFGVAPGTSEKNNSNALKTLEQGNSIFTNTALDPVQAVPWWSGLTEAPKKLTDWLGKPWERHGRYRADHPNSRFTTPAGQCPCISSEWQNPQGVPISAIIFGGRRSKTMPLVLEAFNWRHGVFLGASMASERTAAAEGEVGRIRRDPMAMRPFLGYNVGDYFQHWLNIAKKPGARLPKIFHVNWFRTDSSNNFIWPGFGENLRVLEWILKRVENECAVADSKVGYMPTISDLNIENMNIPTRQIEELFRIHPEEWVPDLQSQQRFFEQIGARLPHEIQNEFNNLCSRLNVDLNSTYGNETTAQSC